MAKVFALLGALVLAGAAPATAQGERSSGAPSADEAAALRLAIDRGTRIYAYDQAAWHTTDALIEDIDDSDGTRIRGWVVTPRENGLLVTYWRPEGDSFAGVYSAVWENGRVRNRQLLLGDDARLSEDQLDLIAARNAVQADGLQLCSDAPFNAVVLPDPLNETLLVYLLTPRTSTSSIPLGGHYRFTVRHGQVLEERSFTNSCLELDVVDPEGRGEPVALGVSHLLDPVPTEIHVFSALAVGKPIYVMTASNKRLWTSEVVDDQVRIKLIQ